MIVEEKIFYPKNVEKEIKWIINNFMKIDVLIEEQKELIISLINNSVSAKLKSEAGYLNSNSFEDIIIKIDESPKIKRLKVWKEVLDIAFSLLSEKEGYPYTVIIEEKYKNGCTNEMLMNKLKINNTTLYYLELDIRRVVYQIALDLELYKE